MSAPHAAYGAASVEESRQVLPRVRLHVRARSSSSAEPPACPRCACLFRLCQGRSFTRLAAAAGAMMAVMCIAVLATRQSPSCTQLAAKRATLINKALASHGYKGVAANIHVQLQSLTLAQKAAISKLSRSERQEMEGEIMLKAAEETLARAAAHKKQQLAQIAFHHQMLSANATNGTNSTDEATVNDPVNAGAFDLSAWLNSYPYPR